MKIGEGRGNTDPTDPMRYSNDGTHWGCGRGAGRRQATCHHDLMVKASTFNYFVIAALKSICTVDEKHHTHLFAPRTAKGQFSVPTLADYKVHPKIYPNLTYENAVYIPSPIHWYFCYFTRAVM